MNQTDSSKKPKEDNKMSFQASRALVNAPEYLGHWHEASEGLFEDF